MKNTNCKNDFLELLTNKSYNVDLASLKDNKLTYEFANKMHFDIRAPGNKSTRDRTLIELHKSPGLMVSAFRFWFFKIKTFIIGS